MVSNDLITPLHITFVMSESFSNDERLQIFNDFYESGDKSKQSQQLASLVT